MPEPLLGVKAFDLTGNLRVNFVRMSTRHLIDAGLTSNGVFPCFCYAVPNGAQDAHARDDYTPSLHNVSLPW